MPDRALKELRKFVVPEVIVGTDARLLAGDAAARVDGLLARADVVRWLRDRGG